MSRAAGSAALLVLLVAGCAQPQAATPDGRASVTATARAHAAAPAWKTLELMDTTWPDAPMAFATIEIPADWTADGGIAPPADDRRRRPSMPDDDVYTAMTGTRDCRAVPFECLAWSARAPDGAQGIALLPSTTWVEPAPPQSPPAQAGALVRATLERLARARHPDARVLAFEPLDAPAPADATVPGDRRWEAGRLTIAFGADGREMRETSSTVLLIGAFDPGDGGARQVMLTTNPPVVLHAPADGFDTLDAERIRTSLTLSDPWWARLADLQREHEEAARRSRCDAAIHSPRPPGCDRLAVVREAGRAQVDAQRRRDFSCRFADVLDNPDCDPRPAQK